MDGPAPQNAVIGYSVDFKRAQLFDTISNVCCDEGMKILFVVSVFVLLTATLSVADTLEKVSGMAYRCDSERGEDCIRDAAATV